MAYCTLFNSVFVLRISINSSVSSAVAASAVRIPVSGVFSVVSFVFSTVSAVFTAISDIFTTISVVFSVTRPSVSAFLPSSIWYVLVSVVSHTLSVPVMQIFVAYFAFILRVSLIFLASPCVVPPTAALFAVLSSLYHPVLAPERPAPHIIKICTRYSEISSVSACASGALFSASACTGVVNPCPLVISSFSLSSSLFCLPYVSSITVAVISLPGVIAVPSVVTVPAVAPVPAVASVPAVVSSPAVIPVSAVGPVTAVIAVPAVVPITAVIAVPAVVPITAVISVPAVVPVSVISP